MRIDRWLELKRTKALGLRLTGERLFDRDGCGRSALAKNHQETLRKLMHGGAWKVPQHFPDEALVDREELAALDHRGFWQARGPLFLGTKSIFVRAEGGGELRGDRHDNDIRLPRIEGLRRNDNRGTLFRRAQVREGKRQEDDGTRFIGCHKSRRRCSPRTGTTLQRVSSRQDPSGEASTSEATWRGAAAVPRGESEQWPLQPRATKRAGSSPSLDSASIVCALCSVKPKARDAH